MTIDTFNNGEGGGDVRAKLNETIEAVNDLSGLTGLLISDLLKRADMPEFAELLYFRGEEGFFLRADPSTLFVDVAGTSPADPGQDVAAWRDESGNDITITQSDAGERPEYQDDPDRLLIASGKRMIADVPAIIGTMVIATDDGTAAYGVDISAGDYLIGRTATDHFPGSELFGQVLIDRELSPSEIESVRQFFIERGAGDDYSGVADFTDYWRDRDEITVFPFVDTSNGTSFLRTWFGCSNLISLPELDVSSGTSFRDAWRGCSSLAEFPLLDVSNGTSLRSTWRECSSLTSFPELDVSSGTTFQDAWRDCSSLTSFPELDVSSGMDFEGTWQNCSSLTSFPELDVSSGTTFRTAWAGCSNLTSFPELDVSNGTAFRTAWAGCSNLTSFPELDVSSGTDFSFAWRDCSGLTSFPELNVSSGMDFESTWDSCSSLTSFPELDLSNGTTFRRSWLNCTSLENFPAGRFDSVTATNFSEAFTNTNLTQQSIDNILASINAANTSNGTFNQSGGSAPSGTGEDAIDDLVARGWTVSVTGGYTP